MNSNFMKNYIAIVMLFGLSLLSTNLLAQEKKQSDEEKKQAIATAQKTLEYIQQSDTIGFKSLMHQLWLDEVTDDQIKMVFNSFKYYLDNYAPPANLDEINVISQHIDNGMLKGMLRTVNFRYVSKNNADSVRMILVGVFDSSKIVNVNLSNPIMQRKLIEPKPTQLHLKGLNLQYKDVSWFRIWYNNGFKDDKKIAGRPYYAVTGGKFDVKALQKQGKDRMRSFHNVETTDTEAVKKMEMSMDSLANIAAIFMSRSDNETLLKDKKVKKMMADVFKYVNQANVDSTDFHFLDKNEKGNPEYIRLRINFTNEEYKNLGEFSIRCVLTDDLGTEGTTSDYIEVKHSELTRYLLSKAKNPELLAALRRLADYDWGDNYEENP